MYPFSLMYVNHFKLCIQMVQPVICCVKCMITYVGRSATLACHCTCRQFSASFVEVAIETDVQKVPSTVLLVPKWILWKVYVVRKREVYLLKVQRRKIDTFHHSIIYNIYTCARATNRPPVVLNYRHKLPDMKQSYTFTYTYFLYPLGLKCVQPFSCSLHESDKRLGRLTHVAHKAQQHMRSQTQHNTELKRRRIGLQPISTRITTDSSTIST